MSRAWSEALEAARKFQRLGAPERRAVLDMMDEMQHGAKLTADEWVQWGLERVTRHRVEGTLEPRPANA